MNKIKKSLCLILSVLAISAFTSQDVNASTRLTPQHLYTWARQGNTARLRQFQKYINLQDQYKNTALCIAQQNEDPKSYALLKKFGASTNVTCHDDDDPICAVVAG